MTTDATTSVSNPGYTRLIGLLDGGAARYRVIDHEPEGVTVVASRLRGHPLAQAAKSIVTRVKLGKKTARFVLAVVPGDRRVDLDQLKRLFDGTYVSFATVDTAERLAGSVSGTIIPFSFDAGLDLLVDPSLLVHPEIFFNAARLDRSIGLNTDDYLALGQPRVARIAQGDYGPTAR